MNLVRYGPLGRERPGLVDKNGIIRDCSSIVPDWTGDHITEQSLARLNGMDLATLPAAPAGERLGVCVGAISKIICVGLNYADHAAESNLPVPDFPILFFKAPTAASGPNDDVELPAGAKACDWEIELGVIIGKRAKLISAAEALSHVFGYCVANDLSERNYSEEGGGQWSKGKSLDTFCPLGPWLVTKDEVPDVQKLEMRLTVNGVVKQKSNTSQMIFDVPYLVSYASKFMTLLPGDVILTGTPYGTGYGHKPQLYLKHGDRIDTEIGGLGAHHMVARQL